MEYKGFTYIPSPKTAWDNLSMLEKSEMMKVAVRNGLTDLKSIREKYNEFAGGGSKRRQESIHNDATQQAMQYFMGKGLTDYQAAGLVGNLFRESRLIPTATNAGSGAYGIAQWLGARKKNLFAKYGKNPTLNQQLDYVWHELGNTHRTGLKAIKSSKNAEEAARNAMGYYEFSAGPEAAIREMRKWGQDGEGAMQKGINFASQLIGGPVVPFRAETPQWDNVPFTPANPEVFFGNPVTTSQPVVNIEPTRTPVLEYDPKEVERQEKRDNLNRFNMFLGMLNGSNESVNESAFPFSMFTEGGKIHISPSKKGTFTAAASRHNMGVQEFASKVLANKDDYSSAMVKKANFARNSSKWKHGLGGNLFEDGGPKKPFTRDDLRGMLQKRRAEAEAVYNGSVTETRTTPNDNAWVDKPLTRRKKNPHLSRRAEEGAKAHAAWEREHPNLAAWGNLAGAIPFAVASVPLGAGIVAGGDALAATAAGQAITSGLTPLYQAANSATIAGIPALSLADAGLTSAFGAHGISQAIEDGGISPMTALEIAPLGRLAKPIAKGAINAGKTAYNKLYTPWKVSSTMNRNLDSNPIIRTYESNPAYRDIGTLLDYQDYIQSMFPNSTIKDVAFHTTTSKPFEAFDPTKVKRGFGFYFSPSEHKLPFNRTVYARVNMENPLVVNTTTNRGLSVDGLAGDIDGTKVALKENNYDGIFGVTNMRNPGEPEIVVLNPRQIHILGSNRDLAGFRRTNSLLPPQITAVLSPF